MRHTRFLYCRALYNILTFYSKSVLYVGTGLAGSRSDQIIRGSALTALGSGPPRPWLRAMIVIRRPTIRTRSGANLRSDSVSVGSDMGRVSGG